MGLWKTREEILESYLNEILENRMAVFLVSDIATETDPDLNTCLSVLFKVSGGNFIAHEFEDGYCERVYPKPVYKVHSVVYRYAASRILSVARDIRKEKQKSNKGDENV